MQVDGDRTDVPGQKHDRSHDAGDLGSEDSASSAWRSFGVSGGEGK